MKKNILKILIAIIIIIIMLLIANIIIINHYKFTLNGSEKIYLNIGDNWSDPLYTIDKNSNNVTIDSNVNYNQEGIYKINYILKIGILKRSLTREIHVLSKDKATNFSLKLKGQDPYYLMKDHPYIEYGVESIDEIDGNISNKVEITNNIDNSTLGTYDVTYKVTNSNGITKTVNRKVIIYKLDFEGKLKTNDYTQSNEIILNITDENYNHTILPNKEKTNNKQINFPVTENQVYSFLIYDNNGNSFQYDVNITNIDKTLPTGTCSLSLFDSYGEIKVLAKDNSGIKGYKYNYGNNSSSLSNKDTYTINTMDNSASVTIYDNANNSNTINCQVINKSSFFDREYTAKYFNHNKQNNCYWFYQPRITKREKVPLVVFFHGTSGNGFYKNVNNDSLPKRLNEGWDVPYYVLAPQSARVNDYVIALINYIIANHPNIDTNRIILSGFSAGTPITLEVSSLNPHKFSGAIIISGYSKTTEIDAKKLTNIPLWFFQGTSDNYSIISSYVNKINSNGGNATLTSYQGGHTAPTDAFFRDDVINWILNTKVK